MKIKKSKITDNIAKIPAIREMRESRVSLADIAIAFNVSSNFVYKNCKDIKVDVKRHKKEKSKVLTDTDGCKTYKINQLSPEDRNKYMSLIPPKKEEEKETFITARKDDYSKAAIFIDSRRGYQNMQGEV